jgi:hypothetical protein
MCQRSGLGQWQLLSLMFQQGRCLVSEACHLASETASTACFQLLLQPESVVTEFEGACP